MRAHVCRYSTKRKKGGGRDQKKSKKERESDEIAGETTGERATRTAKQKTKRKKTKKLRSKGSNETSSYRHEQDFAEGMQGWRVRSGVEYGTVHNGEVKRWQIVEGWSVYALDFVQQRPLRHFGVCSVHVSLLIGLALPPRFSTSNLSDRVSHNIKHHKRRTVGPTVSNGTQTCQPTA
jgi:hypothetical protein